MRKRILLTLGDMGSFNYVLPVIDVLRKRYDLKILVDAKGAAKDPVMRACADLRPTIWNGELVSTSNFDLVLCGTCGKAQTLWRAATVAAHQAGTMVAWFGDFFGSGSESPLKDISPDFMALFDESSAVQFMKRRPGFEREYTKVVGNPAFDALAHFPRPKERNRVRSLLKLTHADRFVYYSASSMKQFDLPQTLSFLTEWARARGYRFGAGFHPADDANVVASLKQGVMDSLGPLFVETRAHTGLPLASSADAFITDYSTTGVEAALLGVPTAFVMFESAQAYQRERGGEYPFFPILKADALALGVWSPADRHKLDRMFLPEHVAALADARRAPAFHVLTDGRAKQRFLEFLEGMLG